jgi:hypothetical protein
MHSAENPVNVPISIARRTPSARVSSCMNAPCSGAICIVPGASPRSAIAAVSAIRSAATSSGCSEPACT